MVLQNHAIKLSKHGYGVIPLHGIVKNKETGERECACAWGRRRSAQLRRGIYKPCGGPGKQPHYDDWGNNFSCDPVEVENMFDPDGFKNCNIGAVTGSATGLFVVDLDGDEGIQSLERLEAEYGALPSTRTVITGSGGRHVHFRMPEGMKLLNTASTIAPKLDTRGEGGQAVLPPSKHICGGEYRWADGLSPDEVELAALPAWFVELNLRATAEGGRKQKNEPDTKASIASRSPSHTKSTASGSGWERFLSEVGDGEGKRGFNAPISEAILSFFAIHGPDADAAPLLASIGDAVDAAERDAKKCRAKYERGSAYLNEQVEQARAKVREQRQDKVDAKDRQAINLKEADAIIDEIVGAKRFDSAAVECMIGLLVEASTLEVTQRFARLSGLKIGLTKDVLNAELARARARANADKPKRAKRTATLFDSLDEGTEYLNTLTASVLFPNTHKIVVVTPRGPSSLSPESAKTWFTKIRYSSVDASGGAREREVFPEWLSAESRPDYYGTDFDPEGKDSSRFNLWQGFATTALQGDWERIRQHILCITCGGDVGAFEYGVGLFAQMLQQPQTKIGVAWCVIGEEGSGKSILFDTMRDSIGMHAMQACGEDDLFNEFNELMTNKVFVYADESPVTGNEAQNERMRNAITSEVMRSTKKGVDKIEVRDCRRFFFTLNPKRHKVQLAVNDRSRRFFVTVTDESRNQCKPYFRAFAAAAGERGRQAMFHDLTTYQCDFDELRTPYRTSGFAAQVERNFEPVEKWWRELLTEGDLPGARTSWERDVSVRKEDLIASYNDWRGRHDLYPLDPPAAGSTIKKCLPVVGTSKDSDNKNTYKLPALHECVRTFKERYGISPDPDDADELAPVSSLVLFPSRWTDPDSEDHWCEDAFESAGFDMQYAAVIETVWPKADAVAEEARFNRYVERLNAGKRLASCVWEAFSGSGVSVHRYTKEAERPVWR